MATRQPIPGYSLGRLVLTLIVLCNAPAFGQAAYFAGGPVVSILDYGAIANDVLADTPALVAAMSGGGRTVRVPAGEYRIGKVSIPSSTVLELDPGAVLRDTGQLGVTDPLISVVGSTNVRITGGQIVASRADYTSGEFRHGVFIRFSSNVEISGVQSSSHGGDGFYIGTGTSYVTIDRSSAFANRRQGLSIVAGTAVLVRDSTFANTSGTNPQCGVDVEPNNNGDALQGIKIQGVRTVSNAGCGIAVGLSAYTAAAPAAIITISGHISTGESRPYVRQVFRSVDRVTYLPALSGSR